MCKALLSIKPEFVDKIFNGEKKYEYRKNIFKNNINVIIIYETSPTKKIVGEATIEEIIFDNVDSVWEKTKEVSGVTNDFFISYYKGREMAVAYKLGEITPYDIPQELADLGVSQAPQSYIYIYD